MASTWARLARPMSSLIRELSSNRTSTTLRKICSSSTARSKTSIGTSFVQRTQHRSLAPSHRSLLISVPLSWIIGAVNNAAMNALHPLAVYAAVQAHKGEKLDFPGSLGSWISVSEHSTAMLTGYLTEWAALNEHCKDQKFNASDTSPVRLVLQ